MTKTAITFEDAAATRLVRKARAAIASGREVMIPKAVVDRLVSLPPACAMRKLQIELAKSPRRRLRRIRSQ